MMADADAAIDGIKFADAWAGRGRTVVLLHGWMCNRHFWKEQIRFLSATHQLLAPDLVKVNRPRHLRVMLKASLSYALTVDKSGKNPYNDHIRGNHRGTSCLPWLDAAPA